MHKEYHSYIYDGPVYEFNRLLNDRWKGETKAPSAEKAKSNLTYQFKKNTNCQANTKIRLTDEVKMVN